MCNDHDNSLRFALVGEFIPFRRRTFSVVIVGVGVLFLFFSLYHNNNLS